MHFLYSPLSISLILSLSLYLSLSLSLSLSSVILFSSPILSLFSLQSPLCYFHSLLCVPFLLLPSILAPIICLGFSLPPCAPYVQVSLVIFFVSFFQSVSVLTLLLSFYFSPLYYLWPPLWSTCNMVASYLVGPGSIPGRVSFTGWGFSRVFPQP